MFKVKVLVGPKSTGEHRGDSAASYHLRCFSNKVEPCGTFCLTSYGLLQGHREVTFNSLLLDETSLPRKAMSRTPGGRELHHLPVQHGSQQ